MQAPRAQAWSIFATPLVVCCVLGCGDLMRPLDVTHLDEDAIHSSGPVNAERIDATAIELVGPDPTSPVRGLAAFELRAGDDAGVERVRFEVDDVEALAVGEPPYVFELDTHALADGPHVVGAVVVGRFESKLLETSVAIDNEPPLLTITSPQEGESVDAIVGSLSVSALASDPSGALQVSFFVDDTRIAVIDEPPYSLKLPLDDGAAPDGGEQVQTLRVEARSPAGLLSEQSVLFEVTRRGLWRYDFGDDVVGEPVGVSSWTTNGGQAVCAATRSGDLHCLDQAGQPLWVQRAANGLEAGPGVELHGALVLGGADGTVSAFDHEGALCWTAHLDDEQPSPVAGPIRPLAANRATPCGGKADLLVPLQDGRVFRLRVTPNYSQTGSAPNVVTNVVMDRDASLSFQLAVGGSMVGTTRHSFVVGAVYDDGVLASVTLDLREDFSWGYGEWRLGDGAVPVAPITYETLSPSTPWGVTAADDGTLYRIPDPFVGGHPEVLARGLGAVSGMRTVAHTGQFLVTTRDGQVRLLSSSGESVWWSMATGDRLSDPVLHGDNVFVRSAPDRVLAFPLLAEGAVSEPDWQVAIPSDLRAAPLPQGCAVYLLGADPDTPQNASLYAFATSAECDVSR